MIEKEENSKILKNKKRNLIIIIVILLILFIGYGISIDSTPEEREKKIISYLEKKYNSKFKIIEMTSSGEHIILNEIDCDGATFCPEIKDKGVYYYRYNVLSLSDNITFEVEYLDKRLKDKITEINTYYSLIHTYDILSDINNYIISTIWKHKTEIISQSISIEFDEKFDDICDSNYKQKLEQISTYVKEKRALDKDLDILVDFTYSDDILIIFGLSEPILKKCSEEYFEGAEGQDIVSGKYFKIYHSLDEYLDGRKNESIKFVLL